MDKLNKVLDVIKISWLGHVCLTLQPLILLFWSKILIKGCQNCYETETVFVALYSYKCL